MFNIIYVILIDIIVLNIVLKIFFIIKLVWMFICLLCNIIANLTPCMYFKGYGSNQLLLFKLPSMNYAIVLPSIGFFSPPFWFCDWLVYSVSKRQVDELCSYVTLSPSFFSSNRWLQHVFLLTYILSSAAICHLCLTI